MSLLLLRYAAGLGKSQALWHAVGKDVCWIDGKASAFGICCTAYEHRDQPLILNDVDGFDRDRQAIEQANGRWRSVDRRPCQPGRSCMANQDDNLKLTAKELAAAFSDPQWSEKFPPLMSIDQAAEMLQVSKDTIYDWRSRGRLKGCCRKVGKHLRFFRNRLIEKLMNEGL